MLRALVNVQYGMEEKEHLTAHKHVDQELLQLACTPTSSQHNVDAKARSAPVEALHQHAVCGKAIAALRKKLAM